MILTSFSLCNTSWILALPTPFWYLLGKGLFSSKEKERIIFHVLVLGVPQEVTQTKTKQIQGGAVLILLLPNPHVLFR